MTVVWPRLKVDSEIAEEDSPNIEILENKEENEGQVTEKLSDIEKDELLRNFEHEEIANAKSVYNKLYKSNIRSFKIKRK